MRQWLTQSICLAALLGAFPLDALCQEEDPLRPDWQRYHSTAAAHALLRGWAETFPDLASVYSIGETLTGTPLLVLEITNQRSGAAADKPGYYYDGNIHAEELAGAEVALHFAWYLLSNYGEDDRVTRLLDTHTLYVRPKFNPDGADTALTTIHNPRSTPRPYDEDGDGLLDEDPANDLDGDGHATGMRVPNVNGQWKKSPEDSRIMLRRGDGEDGGEFYDLLSEGVDDDGDGRFNEDGVGGIDMNRNFPRNWGLEFEQRGAGPYPLSEPETRATIEFLHEHRNITGIVHGHTSGGFLYRLPSTTSWDDYSLDDQNLILELAREYETTTGQPARPSYSNPRIHRYGTLISWGYWDYGVVGFVPEYWGGFGQDYDGDGSITEAERLTWNEAEMDGAGFADWTPYRHPQLGPIEVGGWRARFTRRNPPPRLLESEIEKYVSWMLWLAEISPRLALRNVTVALVGTGVVKLTMVVENEGYLPTNLTQRALDAEVAVPVRIFLELGDAELVSGRERTELGHLAGMRDAQGSSARAATRRELEYVLHVRGESPYAAVTIWSEKGGVIRERISLLVR